ncbi:MAG TPA: phosphotransferase [Microlunatus sp.]|nr:phosphotransferase [Microlunatus sp.]
MHDDQLEITPGQVAALIADQLPQLRGLPMRTIGGGGTVNAIFRLGEAVALRFPLRRQDPPTARAWLEREAAAAEEFRRVSPFPAPRLLRVGDPGHGYPMPWLAQTWLEGSVATPTSDAHSLALAQDLVLLLHRLRACDTKGRTFGGQGRGGRLDDHDDWVADCLRRSEDLVDTDALRQLWDQFRGLPREDADAMCHTDLIPGNLLTRAGRLTGVLDTGGFQPADPALDLVCGWHLLSSQAREVLRRDLGCSDLQWWRGQAWALEQAIGLVWYYQHTNVGMASLGRTTLERLITEA